MESEKEDLSALSQPDALEVFDNLELIQKSPQSLVGRVVHKRFEDHGVCRGSVQSYAAGEDMHSEWPWRIQWDDGGISYFNAEFVDQLPRI